MNPVARLLLAAPFTVCATGAQAKTGTDLVILPAPATAWRITVGHWEGQTERTGSSVVAPRPTAEYARDSYLSASAKGSHGRREALLLEWKATPYSSFGEREGANVLRACLLQNLRAVNDQRGHSTPGANLGRKAASA